MGRRQRELDLEPIERALEDDRPEDALRLAEQELRRHPDSADLHTLLAQAYWALDLLGEAAESLQRALALEPDSPDRLTALARVQFELLDFEEAEKSARRASELEENPEALEILSFILERRGLYPQADSLLEQAHRLDPEEFPLPFRVSTKEFLACADEALAHLPARFRRGLKDSLTMMVESLPAEALLAESEPPLDPLLLGLYTGIPLPDREPSRLSGKLPDHIYLFQRNIERVAPDRKGLVEEIAITLYHEVGHFLGFNEEELEELDFD